MLNGFPWPDYDDTWAIFQFFENADHFTAVGSNYQLDWGITIGKQRVKDASGRPLTVRFELNMGGAPPVFQKGYLSGLGCVADVAR
jgi:hypothetical protein